MYYTCYSLDCRYKAIEFDELCGSLLGTRGYENLSPHIWLMFKCIDFPWFSHVWFVSDQKCLVLFNGMFFKTLHILVAVPGSVLSNMACIVVPFTCVLVSRNSHMYCLFQWSFHVNPMCCACSRLNGFVFSTHMCGNTSGSSESQMRFCFSIMFRFNPTCCIVPSCLLLDTTCVLVIQKHFVMFRLNPTWVIFFWGSIFSNQTCLTRFINGLFLNPKSPMCVLWSANHNSTVPKKPHRPVLSRVRLSKLFHVVLSWAILELCILTLFKTMGSA